ncbi:hypothetical protein HN682_09910 [Candidatus Peregrinibacteria bacterium]|jgi:hypothetical protein|nr:hypothetical protein [Candidatus Peregrinibacteria bacterium]
MSKINSQKADIMNLSFNINFYYNLNQEIKSLKDSQAKYKEKILNAFNGERIQEFKTDENHIAKRVYQHNNIIDVAKLRKKLKPNQFVESVKAVKKDVEKFLSSEEILDISYQDKTITKLLVS